MEPFTPYLMVPTTILVIIFLYMKWSLQHWKRKKIPHLEPTFPFGNLENPLISKKPLSTHFHEFYDRFKKMGVECGGVYLFSSPVLIVTEPEYIKHILTKDFQSFHKRGFYNDEEHQPISANIFTVDGEKWRIARTKFSPAFTSAKMKIMFNLMTDVCKCLEKHVEKHITNKKPLDVQDCVGRVSSDVIGTCVFGIECNSFKDTRFHTIIKSGVAGTTAFVKLSFCNSLPNLARFLRIPLIPRKEGSYLCNSIDDTINYRINNRVARNDFLQLLLEMKNNNIINMNELKAQCVHFFLAGYEGSANTAAFLLFELAYNQDIQQKLREEINKSLTEYNGEMTYKAVMEIKYLDMILSEVLRKYTPVAFLNRRCAEEFRFPNSNFIIEKGTDIVIPSHGLHKDPDYFPDPEKFDPERFSDENKRKIMPYTYLPFGDGPRFCIGDRFAKQEIKIMTANLVKKYKFKLHEEVKVPLKFRSSGLFNAPKDDILFDIDKI